MWCKSGCWGLRQQVCQRAVSTPSSTRVFLIHSLAVHGQVAIKQAAYTSMQEHQGLEEVVISQFSLSASCLLLILACFVLLARLISSTTVQSARIESTPILR